MKFLLGHELLHRVRSVSPESYDAFVEAASKVVPDFKKKVQATMTAYKKAGQKIDKDSAREEVFADFAGEMARDGKLLEKFIGESSPTLWQTLRDYYRKVKDLFTGKEFSDYERAEQALSNALKRVKDIQVFESGGGYSLKPAGYVESLHKTRGVVAPGLESKTVEIVESSGNIFNLNQSDVNLKKEVVAYAREHNLIGVMTDAETNGKGEIKISSKCVKKYADPTAYKKSVSKEIHFAALPHIRKIIASSILAETHPDYPKTEEGRMPTTYNPLNVMHRLYGAIRINGEVYLVKTTIKEPIKTNNPSKAQSYEINEIELVAGQNKRVMPLYRYSTNSISAANLLKGIEKSYDPGKKLIENTETEPQYSLKRELNTETITDTATATAESLGVKVEAINDATKAFKGSYDPKTGAIKERNIAINVVWI